MRDTSTGGQGTMSTEDKYRAALEKIAALEQSEIDGPDDLFHTAQHIAREALT